MLVVENRGVRNEHGLRSRNRYDVQRKKIGRSGYWKDQKTEGRQDWKSR